MKRKSFALALIMCMGVVPINMWANQVNQSIETSVDEQVVSIHQINMDIPMTRAEFMTIVIQALTGVDQFPPIMDTHYAMPVMERAENLGLIDLEAYPVETWSQVMPAEEKSVVLSKVMGIEDVDMGKVYEAFNRVLVEQVTVDGQVVDLNDKQLTHYKGKLMLPLRPIAEAMGFEIEWDSNKYIASLNNGIIESKVQVGYDSYNYSSIENIGMSAPFSAGVAPKFIEGSVYVSYDYFTMFARSEISNNRLDFILK